MGNQVRYYHGGVRGLKQGDKILPPSVTGTSTLLQYAQEIDPDGPQRADRIYLTTDKRAARMYASIVPRGDVYEVIPNGELEHDPDCSIEGYSFQCESATIKRVTDLSVRF
jgi:hypothetical protein